MRREPAPSPGQVDGSSPGAAAQVESLPAGDPGLRPRRRDPAQWSLGLMLLHGRGVRRSERDGLCLLHDAARRGIVGAYISLGWHWWSRPAATRPRPITDTSSPNATRPAGCGPRWPLSSAR